MAAKVKPGPAAARTGARVKVGVVDICGYRTTIWIDPKAELEGQYDYHTGTIVLRPQAFDRMLETLVHEVLHGIFDGSGLGFLLRGRFRMTEEKYDALEEDMIRVLSPSIFATFRRAGWLRLPKLPKLPEKSRHRKG